MLSKTTIYIHADKDSNYETARKLGLEEGATKMFKWALHEVAVEIEVDHHTGEYTILKVDGRTLLP